MDTTQSILDASTLIEIVHGLSEKLRACYVFPDLAEQVCLHLQREFEAGRYAPLKKGNYLALASTMDMQNIAHDEHLWLRWHADPLPEEDSQLRLSPTWQAQRRSEARRDNYGFHRLDWLPGQVGYLDIRYFHCAEWGRDTAVAALRFLANTQALIFDLRQCQGGYPDMLALVSSYLFSSQPVHLDSIYWRDENRIHPHFEAFIPIGRSINPTTGTNREGCGVTPEISVPTNQALKLACNLACEAGQGKSKQ